MKLGTAAAGKATEYAVHLAYTGGDWEKAYDNMGGITLNLANLGSIFDMAGSISARRNGTGQSSLGNIARKFGSTGLLEMNIGRNGISMQLGMGGIDVGGALYDLGKRSYDKSMLKAYEREHGEAKGKAAYNAYVYGDWTQEHTAARLASGKDELEFIEGKKYTARTTSNGRGGRRLNAIQLGHEAYRDGIADKNNSQETIAAVLGHTSMAVRMEEDGKSVNASDVLRAEMEAYKRGDMSALAMHALTNYDSSADYWLVHKDGSISWDGHLNFYMEGEANEQDAEAGKLLDYKQLDSILTGVGKDDSSVKLGNTVVDVSRLKEILKHNNSIIASGYNKDGTYTSSAAEYLLKDGHMSYQDAIFSGKELMYRKAGLNTVTMIEHYSARYVLNQNHMFEEYFNDPKNIEEWTVGNIRGESVKSLFGIEGKLLSKGKSVYHGIDSYKWAFDDGRELVLGALLDKNYSPI